MLDALKFAFELLIVGTLALPWLAVLSKMLTSGMGNASPSYWSLIPKNARATVAIALILAFGYVSGSVISRVSRDMFNDELLGKLPTEDVIRHQVYINEYCKQDLIDMDEYLPLNEDFPSEEDVPASLAVTKSAMHHKLQKEKVKRLQRAFCKDPKVTDETRNERIKEMFSLQEGELLLQGQDKVDRLKQYYDQITVLRGATLNAFILLMVCIFGSLSNLRLKWSGKWYLESLTVVPAVMLAIYGCHSLSVHLKDIAVRDITLKSQLIYADPPLAESILILLGIVGIYVSLKARRDSAYYRLCILACVITTVSYGAWWYTEVMYDLQVVHSQPELHPSRNKSPTDINDDMPAALPSIKK